MGKFQSVGGQAVIEGVMMKNQDTYAVCVRNSSKEIITDVKQYTSLTKRHKVLGIPFLRGIIAFGESMVLGMKILTYSAEFFEIEDEEESKFDMWINNKFGDKANDILIGISVVLALFMAVGLFVLLPLGLSQLLKPFLPSARWINFSDGMIRVVVLLTYVSLISKMKDIQRVFQYHGAEHSRIRVNC